MKRYNIDVAKKINDEIKKNVASYLNRKMIEWEHIQNKHLPASAFAVYLNVSAKSLNDWLNAVVSPRDDSVIKIANRLGSEIYDILEWERPKEMPPNATSDTASSNTVTDLASPNTTTKRKHKIQPAPDNAINLLTGGGGKTMNVAILQRAKRGKKVKE